MTHPTTQIVFIIVAAVTIITIVVIFLQAGELHAQRHCSCCGNVLSLAVALTCAVTCQCASNSSILIASILGDVKLPLV